MIKIATRLRNQLGLEPLKATFSDAMLIQLIIKFSSCLYSDVQ